MDATFEELAKQLTLYLARGVEVCAAVLIGLAAVRATAKALILFVRRGTPDLNDESVRLSDLKAHAAELAYLFTTPA